LTGSQKVRGSIPRSSTNYSFYFNRLWIHRVLRPTRETFRVT